MIGSETVIGDMLTELKTDGVEDPTLEDILMLAFEYGLKWGMESDVDDETRPSPATIQNDNEYGRVRTALDRMIPEEIKKTSDPDDLERLERARVRFSSVERDYRQKHDARLTGLENAYARGVREGRIQELKNAQMVLKKISAQLQEARTP